MTMHAVETISLRDLASLIGIEYQLARTWWQRGWLGHELGNGRTRELRLPRAEAFQRAQVLADAWRLLKQGPASSKPRPAA